jgi:hypothetical protein
VARARNIKPGFFKNYELADLGPLAQLLFAGLWCLADKEGRLEDKPRLIKAEVFPYYDVDVNGELTKLARLGFVKRYSVKGVALISIDNFKKHQSPHHTEKASELAGEDEADLAEPYPVRTPEINGEIPVNSQEQDGGNPPDSLILRFTDSLIPDSGFSDSPIPEQPRLPPAAPEAAPKKSRAEKPAVQTSETWSAFETAYEGRYGARPVRNAMVNGQMANFVKRLGQEEAPAVAAWYLSHNNRYYVQVCHSVAAMVKDAEKLRTEWVRRRQVTAAEATQADKTQTNFNAFAPLIDAAREREAREANNA